MLHTSFLEISESALVHNLEFIRGVIGQDIVYSSVVKGNAYGHGIEYFVPLAEKCGVRHFSVFSADEAFRVKKVSTEDSTIMVMGMLDEVQLTWAIKNDIEFFVFDFARLDNALDIARKMHKKAKVHIEMETGMNRTGFPKKQLSQVIEVLKENPKHISFEGFCTHYAGAESIANYYRIKKQQRTYNSLFKKVTSLGLLPKLKHTACSAATLRYPKTRMDLVRVGILQYGFFPNKETFVSYLEKQKEKIDPLQRLISWKSRVMDIKEVKIGEFIGYGTSYLANSAMRIAIVPVGYSHGFSRSLSNQGRVLIRGQRVGVIGVVNMNMMSVDITGMVGIERGDEVVLIGRQGNLQISVSSFSEFSEQINYELLVRLPSDLPRKIVE